MISCYYFFFSTSADNNTDSYYDVRCRPSVGIYYRCKKVNGNQHCGSFAVEGLSTDPSMFPTVWKVALVLMSTGIFINFLMSVMAVGSFCKQAIRKKSVFGVAGSGQGLAGKNPFMLYKYYISPTKICYTKLILGLRGVNSILNTSILLLLIVSGRSILGSNCINCVL